jgi:3-dehydroquinate dehydratase-2
VRIGVVHGPNLRLLGRREPEVYGSATLEQVNDALRARAASLGVELDIFQSNSEGAILDHLETSASAVDGYLVNPGGLTHTSVALRDGLVGVGRPCVEVHLSNPDAREGFRHHSYVAGVAVGRVAGFGLHSYLLGLEGLVRHLSDR